MAGGNALKFLQTKILLLEMKLELKNITKYVSGIPGNNFLLLENVNLLIESSKGEITTLLGPVRSGKSTLLRIISGIEKADLGDVLIDDKRSSGILPYIPEKSASFPWFTVEENLKDLPALKRDAGELIKMVGLDGYEDHIPDNNSPGFRFRISLAKAIAVNPSILLIDESLKSMKPETKVEIIKLLKEISSMYGIGIIYSTSDISDAVSLSEKIFLMRKNPGTIFHRFLTHGERMKDISGIEELLIKENLINKANFSI